MGMKMKVHSRTRTRGSALRNLTCAAYAVGPLSASKFERRCSTKNAPMGMMPSSECSLRQRKLVPLAARIGCTPERTLGAAGFWAVAIGMRLLSASGAESGAVGYQIEG